MIRIIDIDKHQALKSLGLKTVVNDNEECVVVEGVCYIGRKALTECCGSFCSEAGCCIKHKTNG